VKYFDQGVLLVVIAFHNAINEIETGITAGMVGSGFQRFRKCRQHLGHS